MQSLNKKETGAERIELRNPEKVPRKEKVEG